MSFLEKIEPYLLSEDMLIQEFVLHALHEYPNVPPEWTEKLLKEAIRSKEKETSILVYTENQPLNEGAVEALIEGVKKAEKSKRHLYLRLLHNIEPDTALKYKQQLKSYIKQNTWDFYHLLLHGTEEEIWEEYGAVLARLDEAIEYDQTLFTKAKWLVKTLVENGWMPEDEIALVLNEQMKEEWFSFGGILAVYAVGLLQLKEYIPLLASLLVRDEDILLEETAEALISFQSDDVLRAAAPYLTKRESVIFTASVFENIKSPLAVEMLREAYKQMEDEEDQATIIEALCRQLAREALPEMEHYMKQGYDSYLIDTEQVVYSCYMILGEHHPELENWKQDAVKREIDFRTRLESPVLPAARVQPASMPYIKTEKIGRNDPCTCGSGKKYKKCCG